MPDDGPQDEAVRGTAGASDASGLASLFASRPTSGSAPAGAPEDLHALFADLPTPANSTADTPDTPTAAMPLGGTFTVPTPTAARNDEDVTEALTRARVTRAIRNSVGDDSMHLFDNVRADDADPADAAHPSAPFPPPLRSRHEPEHAAPRYGISRPQWIALGIGAVVTLIGVGWALATPPAPAPVPVVEAKPSPTATIDTARIAKVNDSIGAVASGVQAAHTSAASFEAPLVEIAGYCDDAARVAAEAARQAYVAALAAVRVPAQLGPTADTATLDQSERDVASAQTALATATSAFRTAITMFTQSIPPHAAAALQTNADADESFRTAATAAAAVVADSDPFGPTAFGAWHAWRTALANLIADEARVIDEQRSYYRGNGGGTNSGGSGTQAPQDPAPPAPPAPEAPPVDTAPPTTP